MESARKTDVTANRLALQLYPSLPESAILGSLGNLTRARGQSPESTRAVRANDRRRKSGRCSKL